MKKSSRILIAFFSLLLIVLYFVPIWSISLQAPQYPEGLGMKIWINKMSGDLNIINGLNHYIGMKTIHPESIKELSVMPLVIAFFIAAGLLVSILNKRKLVLAWIVLFVIAGIAGMTDFYMWEYDYGHNLDPTAAIKITGMNYQPPLIGSKNLLNFTATSLPDTGGYIFFITGIVFILVFFYERKTREKTGGKI
ncbi:MAG: hypothetical protein JSS91_00615 [Bacteroidetes bacterium]|nr:hypothetical protein [Bacteroidota bacterium]